ncbi:Uncharacterised protein [Serratia ficaria]|uniref:hypothetical protein n=1 Tax=Serratia ficaria TaxID=61651 RepID=UPI002182BB82|nr:hypothetical protein [Serratia ficaria]CAI2492672.1 Uncharacterised protein [Serratia ficaria]CAI2533727.1 Uncharacterised protein [Serratia ficaria]
MLRIITDGETTNDDIPYADSAMEMNNEFSIATWGMQDDSDSSGNGHHLSGSLTFNEFGIVTAAANGRIATGLVDASEFTMVLAINMQNISAAGNLISNLMGANTPFSGFRIVISATGTISVSVGSTSGNSNRLSLGGGTGAWTCFAVSVKDDLINARRSNGDVYSLAVDGRIPGTLPMYINGAPDGSPLAAGVQGNFGMLAYYDHFYSSADCAPLIADMIMIMRERGAF